MCALDRVFICYPTDSVSVPVYCFALPCMFAILLLLLLSGHEEGMFSLVKVMILSFLILYLPEV